MGPARPLRARFTDLPVRLASGLVLAGVTFGAIWLGGGAAVLLATAAAGVLAWEVLRVLLRDRRRGVAVGAALAAALAALVAAMPALAVLALPFVVLLGRVGPPWGRWAAAVLAAVSVTLGLAAHMRGALGAEPFFWLFAVVIAADVGGYVFGRLIGGPRLWPAVSPAKTWAGFCGGMAAAFAAGLLGAASGWVGWAAASALSLPIALASVAGDLAASAAKRRLRLKDSSALIPGHGGLWDRADGVLPALLLFCVVSAF